MSGPYFSDDHSRQISAAMQANHVLPERADLAASLAVAAANQAATAFAAELGEETGHDTAIRLMAAEVGAQLAREHFAGIFARLYAMGRASGLPQVPCELDLAREAAHG